MPLKSVLVTSFLSQDKRIGEEPGENASVKKGTSLLTWQYAKWMDAVEYAPQDINGMSAHLCGPGVVLGCLRLLMSQRAPEQSEATIQYNLNKPLREKSPKQGIETAYV